MDKPNWKKIYLVVLGLMERVKFPIETKTFTSSDVLDVLDFCDKQVQKENRKRMREERKRNVQVCRSKK